MPACVWRGTSRQRLARCVVASGLVRLARYVSNPPSLSIQTPLIQPHLPPLFRRFCIVTTKIGFSIGFHNTNSILTFCIYINVLPSIRPACKQLKMDFVLVSDNPSDPRRIAKLTMYCELQCQMSARGSLY